MPTESRPSSTPTGSSLPPAVSAVPRRLRLIGRLVAVALVLVFAVAAVLLKESTTGAVAFRTADQVAMMCLGLMLAGAALLITRPRVDADADGIRVRNIVTGHQLPWQAVLAVRFDESSPWATLLLTNEDEVAVLAVQAADKERAVAAVVGLRALHAAARARSTGPGGTRG